MKKSRGFVGPLGDDIPSIFPLVAGILLFVGTLFYVNNLAQEKNDYLEVRKAALGLSYIMTESGKITFETDFNGKCDKLKSYADSHAANFLVTVKRFCTQIDVGVSEAGSSPYHIPQKAPPGKAEAYPSTWLYCTNAKPAPTPGIMPQPGNAVLLNYPVAVPCNPEKADDVTTPFNGLGMINVIAWKK